MECVLYDQLGCGGSVQPTIKWDAYSAAEMLKDLEAIVSSALSQGQDQDQDETDVPLFLAAHSYAVSQTIHLFQRLTPLQNSRIKGIFLISGGLVGGPSPLLKDGGHWIFRLPMPVLRRLQPTLSEAFVTAAIHDPELREKALEISKKNDMKMCRAFYRQQKWATVEDALSIKSVPALVIHGEQDQIMPLAAGKHLHDSLPKSEFCVVPDASHQVFEEKAPEVAKMIWWFIEAVICKAVSGPAGGPIDIGETKEGGTKEGQEGDDSTYNTSQSVSDVPSDHLAPPPNNNL